MDLQTPRVVGPYAVEGVLGTGAFSVVYRVREAETGRALALKLLTPGEMSQRERRLRFQREVEIASRLEHPNLVRVLGWGDHEGHPYCTMELVEGPSLRQVIHQRPSGPSPEAWRERVSRLGTPLFAALQYIHNQHVVHRDLKPENVLVADGDVPRLGDFGLALSSRSSSQRSMAGTLTGTLAYMAPEVFSGSDSDRRTDIYALGIMLMELIAGRIPYRHEEVAPLLNIILTEGPLPLSELDTSIPQALERMLRRMTARQPEDRYFTVSEAYQDWLAGLAAWSQQALPNSVLAVEGRCGLFDAEFVGGKTQLERLDAARAAADAGRPQVVLIEGEAGLGKSRLMAHWLRSLEPTAQLFDTVCAMGQDVPYQAFSFLDILISPESTAPSGSVHDVSRAERVRVHEEARRRGILDMAHRSLLVLAVDNVQWMDTSSLELLEYLLQRLSLSSARILILLAMRPEELQSDAWLTTLEARSGVTRFKLDLLDETELEQLARSALGTRQLPTDLPRVLGPESGGNPFVLLEVLNGFVEEGVLQLAASAWLWNQSSYDRWVAALRGGETGSSLDRVREMILRRLKLMPETERELLAVCAIGGGGFTYEEVLDTCAILEHTDREGLERRVLDGLDSLVAGHVLREARERQHVRYTFVNQKVQQVVSTALSQSRRLHLHRAWARVLETGLAEVSSGDAFPRAQRVFRLLEHLEQTGEWAQAGRLVVTAAEIAASAHAHRLAWQLYTRLVDAHRSQRFLSADELRQIVLRTAELASLAGEYAVAMTLLEPQLQLAPDGSVRVRRMMARTAFDGGNFARALELWREVLDEMQIPLPGQGIRGWGKVLRAFARSAHRSLSPAMLRQPEQAETVMEICEGIVAAGYFLGMREPVIPYAIALTMQVAQATGRRDWMAQASMMYSLIFIPRVPPAAMPFLRFATAAEKHADTAGDARMVVKVLRNLAYGYCMIGDPATGRRLARRGEELAREIVDMNGVAWHLVVGAFAQRFLGDLGSAERQLLEGRDLVFNLQHRSLAVNMRLGLAHVYLLQGRYDLALKALETPLDFEVITPLNELIQRIYRGIIELRRGNVELACEHLSSSFDDAWRVGSGTLWIMLAGQYYAMAIADARQTRGMAEMRRIHSRCLQAAGSIPLWRMRASGIAAEIELLSGRKAQAEHLFDEAARFYEGQQLKVELATCRERQAILLRTGLRPVAELWDQVGAPWQKQQLLVPR